MPTLPLHSAQPIDAGRWLTATYRVRASADTIDTRAQALALEQSVEAPLAAVSDERVLREVVAQVASVDEKEAGLFAVTLRIAVETTGFEAGQLLNMLFGNSSLQEDVALIDADFPPSLVVAFGGPRFGIAGIRSTTQAFGRPLTCAALKPQGLSATQLAELAGIFARAGVDVVKDDHGLADQDSAPFAQRVACVQRAIDEANADSGGHCVYAPSVTGHYGQIRLQAEQARSVGVKMMLLAPMISGTDTLLALAREARTPILAHPALAGAARIAPPLLLGKLFRLFGADATIFPNAGGRFSFTQQTCTAIANGARTPWHGLAPTLPVPAGGMALHRVPEMRALYGDDTMLLIGGDLLLARDGLFARAREFVAAAKNAGAQS